MKTKTKTLTCTNVDVENKTVTFQGDTSIWNGEMGPIKSYLMLTVDDIEKAWPFLDVDFNEHAFKAFLRNLGFIE